MDEQLAMHHHTEPGGLNDPVNFKVRSAAGFFKIMLICEIRGLLHFKLECASENKQRCVINCNKKYYLSLLYDGEH